MVPPLAALLPWPAGAAPPGSAASLCAQDEPLTVSRSGPVNRALISGRATTPRASSMACRRPKSPIPQPASPTGGRAAMPRKQPHRCRDRPAAALLRAAVVVRAGARPANHELPPCPGRPQRAHRELVRRDCAAGAAPRVVSSKRQGRKADILTRCHTRCACACECECSASSDDVVWWGGVGCEVVWVSGV